ncbi:MAG TPA: lipoprotein signal peptidase [Sulfurimonas sp.]|nr:lipoprotein signal peptidase [Sulfurimonas sp.]
MALALVGIFIIDQNIKQLFLEGYRYYSDYMDLILVFNRGVAFSMFSFLKEYLKWIQVLMITGVVLYTLYLNNRIYSVPVGILVGAGFSNVYDRFIHEGVVDMVYWHGWPYPIFGQAGFAVFNFADVMIDLAVVWLLWVNWQVDKKSKNEVKNP